MSILIPPKLERRLSSDDQYLGAVKQTAAALDVLLAGTSFVFFPEYTDHGTRHVQKTLDAADWLITDSAHEKLSAEAAGILCLSIMLHDVALAFSEESFLALLRRKARTSRVQGFKDPPWIALWGDYLSESMRWDGRKRLMLLGTSRPVPTPGDDPLGWTGSQKRLIGEFIRRHHPRVAQEVALFGFPGAEEQFRLPKLPDARDAQLIGIVARSHGTALRDTFGPLNQIIGRYASYGSVDPVYLMAVLRIADFLDVDASRAPDLMYAVKALRSPVSRREWRMHGAIGKITSTHEDNEAIYVHAFPEDLGIFLRTSELLRGLQSELDTTWAVLGEVYSRQKPWLGIVLRRVRSNLDDLDEFKQGVPYIPVRAELRSAGSDLLKLLITPLYGNRPEIGVRELLQNAVDAVASRVRLDSRNKRAVTSEDTYNVIVRLEQLDSGDTWIEFLDSGIGMDVDVVLNYFLTAGAQIRRSESWKDLNVERESTAIVFTGRFGIGVLAGFILGDQIHVQTRHARSPAKSGIRFAVSIDDEVVQLARVTCEVGTRIRIKLSKFAAESLMKSPGAWDWYCFDSPRVTRITPAGENLPQAWIVPAPDQPVPDGWMRFSLPSFPQIDWTYQDAPGLTCNGFIVREKSTGPDLRVSDTVVVRWPNVSVIDKDANLPLTMDRNGLTESLPFADELEAEIAKHYLEFSLAQAPRGWSLSDTGALRWFLRPPYPGEATSRQAIFAQWIFDSDNCFPLDRWNVSQMNLETLHLVGYHPDSPPINLEVPGPVLLASVGHAPGQLRFFIEQVIRPLLDIKDAISSIGETRNLSIATLPQDVFWDYGLSSLQLLLRTEDYNQLDNRTRELLTREFESSGASSGVTYFSTTHRRIVDSLTRPITAMSADAQPRALVRLRVRRRQEGPSAPSSPLASAWQRFLDGPAIASSGPIREAQIHRFSESQAASRQPPNQ